MYRRAFRAAFPATVPVLMGYLSIGIAFGLMLEAIGYNAVSYTHLAFWDDGDIPQRQ